MALSLDLPFWPQLPRLSYYEDMYVQAAEHFPGIVLDLDKRTLGFSMDTFMEELEGPISFGFNVLDQNDRPILFDDTVRPFLYEVMARARATCLDDDPIPAHVEQAFRI